MHREDEAEQALAGEESIDCWMNGAWSNTTVNVAPCRGSSSRSGRARARPWTRRRCSPTGSLVTAMVSAGLPLTREMRGDGVLVLLRRWRRRAIVHSARPAAARRWSARPAEARRCRRPSVMLRAGLHGEGLVVLGDGAAGNSTPFWSQRVADRLLGVARGRELRRVGGDRDALADTADDLRGVDARDVLDAGHDRRLELRLDRLGVVVAGDGELDHREVVDARRDDVRLDP